MDHQAKHQAERIHDLGEFFRNQVAPVHRATGAARIAQELARRGMKEAAAVALGPLDSRFALARGERRGALACFATDTSRLDELAPRFLGEDITSFELVDL